MSTVHEFTLASNDYKNFPASGEKVAAAFSNFKHLKIEKAKGCTFASIKHFQWNCQQQLQFSSLCRANIKNCTEKISEHKFNNKQV